MRVKRSPRRRPPSRSSSGVSLPYCILGVLVVVYMVGFIMSGKLSDGQQQQDYSSLPRTLREQSSGVENENLMGLTLHGATSCATAKNKVHTGEWIDPNKGRIYARETLSTPHFHIALHDKAYDEVRWRIMEEGKYYEEEVHDRFVQILSKSKKGLVVDVGANIGYYTLLSLALGHDVVSFEPNPANMLRLCDSLRVNDWNAKGRNHIFQNAVGNVHGQELTLHAPRNPGQGFLKPVEPGDEKTDEHKAKTTIVSLDKFAEEQGWFDTATPSPSIRLLKVDVEGKDPQVILGAPRLLKSGMVENVLTECRRFGRPVVSEMFMVLLDAGFVVKEPQNVKMDLGSTSKERAKAIVDWAFDTLGQNSQRNVDMWWVTA